MAEPVVIGNATLYLGDCREIAPTIGRVGSLITDPPYGLRRDGQKGMKSKARGRVNSRTHHPELGWDSDRPSREELASLIEQAENSIIWGGNYLADLLPRSWKWLVWDKGQSLNQSDCELAWTSLPGALRTARINRAQIGRDSGVWRGPSFHPTQKPVSLMDFCLSQIDAPGLVFDPYMGSGSTGVACMRRGIPFVGIEREQKYFDVALRRFETELAQRRLIA